MKRLQIGFTNGCFDLLHEGHKHFLNDCVKGCDYLIVAVNSDASVRRLKGKDRPVVPWAERAIKVLAYLAVCNSWPSYAVIPFEGREEGLLMEIRPDVIFKGADHSPDLTHLVARGIGWKTGEEIWKAPIVHVARLPGFSTTKLIADRRA